MSLNEFNSIKSIKDATASMAGVDGSTGTARVRIFGRKFKYKGKSYSLNEMIKKAEAVLKKNSLAPEDKEHALEIIKNLRAMDKAGKIALSKKNFISKALTWLDSKISKLFYNREKTLSELTSLHSNPLYNMQGYLASDQKPQDYLVNNGDYCFKKVSDEDFKYCLYVKDENAIKELYFKYDPIKNEYSYKIYSAAQESLQNTFKNLDSLLEGFKIKNLHQDYKKSKFISDIKLQPFDPEYYLRNLPIAGDLPEDSSKGTYVIVNKNGILTLKCQPDKGEEVISFEVKYDREKKLFYCEGLDSPSIFGLVSKLTKEQKIDEDIHPFPLTLPNVPGYRLWRKEILDYAISDEFYVLIPDRKSPNSFLLKLGADKLTTITILENGIIAVDGVNSKYASIDEAVNALKGDKNPINLTEKELRLQYLAPILASIQQLPGFSYSTNRSNLPIGAFLVKFNDETLNYELNVKTDENQFLTFKIDRNKDGKMIISIGDDEIAFENVFDLLPEIKKFIFGKLLIFPITLPKSDDYRPWGKQDQEEIFFCLEPKTYVILPHPTETSKFSVLFKDENGVSQRETIEYSDVLKFKKDGYTPLPKHISSTKELKESILEKNYKLLPSHVKKLVGWVEPKDFNKEWESAPTGSYAVTHGFHENGKPGLVLHLKGVNEGHDIAVPMWVDGDNYKLSNEVSAKSIEKLILELTEEKLLKGQFLFPLTISDIPYYLTDKVQTEAMMALKEIPVGAIALVPSETNKFELLEKTESGITSHIIEINREGVELKDAIFDTVVKIPNAKYLNSFMIHTNEIIKSEGWSETIVDISKCEIGTYVLEPSKQIFRYELRIKGIPQTYKVTYDPIEKLFICVDKKAKNIPLLLKKLEIKISSTKLKPLQINLSENVYQEQGYNATNVILWKNKAGTIVVRPNKDPNTDGELFLCFRNLFRTFQLPVIYSDDGLQLSGDSRKFETLDSLVATVEDELEEEIANIPNLIRNTFGYRDEITEEEWNQAPDKSYVILPEGDSYILKVKGNPDSVFKLNKEKGYFENDASVFSPFDSEEIYKPLSISDIPYYFPFYPGIIKGLINRLPNRVVVVPDTNRANQFFIYINRNGHFEKYQKLASELKPFLNELMTNDSRLEGVNKEELDQALENARNLHTDHFTSLKSLRRKNAFDGLMSPPTLDDARNLVLEHSEEVTIAPEHFAPAEKQRVKLSNNGYVHASEVKIGHSSMVLFQLPLGNNQEIGKKHTFSTSESNTWQMIWEKDLDVIINLTGETEKKFNQTKENTRTNEWTTEYFPPIGEKIKTKDGLTIEQEPAESIQDGKVKIMHFKITNKDGIEKKLVMIRALEWVDFGTLEPKTLVELAKLKRQYNAKNLGIHCRAGLGRTGVLATVIEAMDEIDTQIANVLAGKQKSVKMNDILVEDSIIYQLRLQRNGTLIQTEEQFWVAEHAIALYLEEQLKKNGLPLYHKFPETTLGIGEKLPSESELSKAPIGSYCIVEKEQILAIKLTDKNIVLHYTYDAETNKLICQGERYKNIEDLLAVISKAESIQLKAMKIEKPNKIENLPGIIDEPINWKNIPLNTYAILRSEIPNEYVLWIDGKAALKTDDPQKIIDLINNNGLKPISVNGVDCYNRIYNRSSASLLTGNKQILIRPGSQSLFVLHNGSDQFQIFMTPNGKLVISGDKSNQEFDTLNDILQKNISDNRKDAIKKDWLPII